VGSSVAGIGRGVGRECCIYVVLHSQRRTKKGQLTRVAKLGLDCSYGKDGNRKSGATQPFPMDVTQAELSWDVRSQALSSQRFQRPAAAACDDKGCPSR
jgi:hypothetical protein